MSASPPSSSDDDDIVFVGVVKPAAAKKHSAERAMDTSRAEKKGRIEVPVSVAQLDQHNPGERFDHNENTDVFKGYRSFCLLLYVDPDETLRKFITSCKDSSSSEFNKCLQFPGTEHFTMFNRKNLTYSEAVSISYIHSRDDALPIMNLDGFTTWGKDGVFLTTNTSIGHLASRISAPFTWGIQKNLHLSLYRRRGMGKEVAEAQARTIKNKLHHQPKGSARGAMIVLKEMGKDYFGRDGSFFRVIYKQQTNTAKSAVI